MAAMEKVASGESELAHRIVEVIQDEDIAFGIHSKTGAAPWKVALAAGPSSPL